LDVSIGIVQLLRFANYNIIRPGDKNMSDNAPTRDPEEREIRHIRQLGRIEGKRVLEIGCGEGRMTWRYMALPTTITGIDPDFESLAEALHTRPVSFIDRMTFAQAKAEHLPFSTERFEAVLFSWSF
jgi:ubiquinone/menaquinone biosynthesis C-methylase UbiE